MDNENLSYVWQSNIEQSMFDQFNDMVGDQGL
jgi:hypothetical protein